jgi:anti-sigma factor RsiW
MDHTDATATQATERYLLGELSAEETSAFEEHYFDCRLCADDVRAGTAFFEGGRRLVREEREQERPVAPVAQIDHHPRWRRWLPAAAAAMFAYLTMVPVLMRGPVPMAVVEIGQPIHVPAAELRDGAANAIIVTGKEPVLFSVPATEENHLSYHVRLLDSSGNAVRTRVLKQDETLDPLSLTIHGVEPGVYHLSISAGQPLKEIDRIPVIVKR